MEARMLFLHALSPLHAGTGQGAGAIDLPVAREKATGLPYLPGSSLKGVLRDACKNGETRKKVFGPDKDSAHEHAGSVQFSDQRLLLLPVRSLRGTFAWVTSPYILRRCLRDAENVLLSVKDLKIPLPDSIDSCYVPDDGCVITLDDQRVIFEDLDFTTVPDDSACVWAEWIGKRIFPDDADADWREMLAARFCVVHDDVMGFLLETATEVFARIRLGEAKTVENNALWYEEALPAETILSGLVFATPVKAGPEVVFETLEGLMEKPLQLGGKATVGRGLCRLRMAGGGNCADPQPEVCRQDLSTAEAAGR